jgi:hypothetical protein
MIAWGIAITARPVLFDGIASTIQRQMPRHAGTFLRSAESAAQDRERLQARRPEVAKNVLAERVIGVSAIALGTLLNGYGDLLGKWFLAS